MTVVDLFQVIRRNEKDIFYSGIDKADINQVNEDGQNLLHESVASNNLEFANELIKRKIDINHKDLNSQTPLHYVAYHKTLEIAELILIYGASLAIEDNYGNQPLWIAVFNARGDYEMVKTFLKFKPDVNHKNKNGKSPLDFAKQIHDQALVNILENS